MAYVVGLTSLFAHSRPMLIGSTEVPNAYSAGVDRAVGPLEQRLERLLIAHLVALEPHLHRRLPLLPHEIVVELLELEVGRAHVLGVERHRPREVRRIRRELRRGVALERLDHIVEEAAELDGAEDDAALLRHLLPRIAGDPREAEEAVGVEHRPKLGDRDVLLLERLRSAPAEVEAKRAHRADEPLEVALAIVAGEHDVGLV